MEKICLIRSEKDYLKYKNFNYDKSNDKQEVIREWESVFNFDYWQLRSLLRDVVVENVNKFTWDKVFYDYDEFGYYINEKKFKDDLILYSQDDDDVLIKDIPITNDLKNEPIHYIWRWIFVDLPYLQLNENYKTCTDEIVQSNHSYLYIPKTDLDKHLYNPVLESTKPPGWEKTPIHSIFERPAGHLYYHAFIDQYVRQKNIKRIEDPQCVCALNFCNLTSITTLRNHKGKMKKLKSMVEPIIDYLDKMHEWFHLDMATVYRLKAVYAHLL